MVVAASLQKDGRNWRPPRSSWKLCYQGSPGGGNGSQRLVCRIPFSRQAQCTSRRDFAPVSPSIHRAFHGERADKSDCSCYCGGLGDGCEVRSVKIRHNTNCIDQGNIKRAQVCCPWSPPQGGARDQSASVRWGWQSKGEAHALHHQPHPCGSIDLDHVLPLLSFSHWLLLRSSFSSASVECNLHYLTLPARHSHRRIFGHVELLDENPIP
jgi:hypothetical protein